MSARPLWFACMLDELLLQFVASVIVSQKCEESLQCSLYQLPYFFIVVKLCKVHLLTHENKET